MGRRAAITHVVDDRGVTHAVRAPGNDVARAVLAEVEAQGYVRLGPLPILSLAVAALVTLALFFDLWRGASTRSMILQVFVIACSLFGAWTSWHHVAAQVGPRYRRAILKVGRCPVCCYLLAGLDPQTDGVVLCPECGAAWRPAGV